MLLLMGIFSKVDAWSKVISALLGFCISISESILRNPLILMTTIKKNKENQATLNQIELREQKRQVEIQEAMEKRSAYKKQLNDQTKKSINFVGTF